MDDRDEVYLASARSAALRRLALALLLMIASAGMAIAVFLVDSSSFRFIVVGIGALVAGAMVSILRATVRFTVSISRRDPDLTLTQRRPTFCDRGGYRRQWLPSAEVMMIEGRGASPEYDRLRRQKIKQQPTQR
jgi:hypothetical protein